MKGMPALVASLLALFSDPSIPQTRPGSYREEARVERVVVDAYVTNPRGDSIPDLAAADFRLRVDGRTVAIESVDWIAVDQAEVEASGAFPKAPLPLAAPPALPEAGAPQIPPPGRLFILFFQTDLSRETRAIGLLRIAYWARHFVATLLPTDRAAVVSFDSHLKLRQDFTVNREKLIGAMHAAIRTGPPGPPDRDAFPSLARNFDFKAARLAVTPEKALAIVAQAAAPILGAKSMIYFGYGLETIGGLSGPNPRDRLDLEEAMPAIGQARISVFTIDTPVNGHTLAGTLQGLASLTGGFYQKPDFLPEFVLGRVLRATSGRYVIVFKKPNFPPGIHAIVLALAGRSGSVHAKLSYTD